MMENIPDLSLLPKNQVGGQKYFVFECCKNVELGVIRQRYVGTTSSVIFRRKTFRRNEQTEQTFCRKFSSNRRKKVPKHSSTFPAFIWTFWPYYIGSFLTIFRPYTTLAEPFDPFTDSRFSKPFDLLLYRYFLTIFDHVLLCIILLKLFGHCISSLSCFSQFKPLLCLFDQPINFGLLNSPTLQAFLKFVLSFVLTYFVYSGLLTVPIVPAFNLLPFRYKTFCPKLRSRKSYEAVMKVLWHSVSSP